MAIFNGEDLSRIVTNSVQQQFDELTKQMEQEVKTQDVLYWDTETNNELPVSIGLFKQSATESYMKNLYLSYEKRGPKAKNGQELVKKHEKTIEEIMKAANMTDKNGKLLDSANQMWRDFTGHDASANFASQDSQKELLMALQNKFSDENWVKENIIDLSQLSNILNSSKELAGYNTEKFDVSKMKAYMVARGRDLGSAASKKLIAKLNQTRDIRKNVRGFVSQMGQVTGLDTDFLGGQTLQELVSLIYGEKDANAHQAASDARSTAIVDANLDKIEKVYNIIIDNIIQVAAQKGVSLTEIDKNGNVVYSQSLKTILKEVMHSLSTGINVGSNTQIKNQSTPSVTANTQTALPADIKNTASAMAVKKVKDLYNQYGVQNNTTAQKALTGAHLLERMRKLGKEVSNITPAFYGEDISSDTAQLAEGSMAYYLAQIADTAEANGMGVKFYGDNGGLAIGFYNKNDEINGQIDDSKISKIQVGMIDDNGLVNLGNQKLVNMLVPTLQWTEDANGNKKANTYLSTVMEEQLEGISRVIKSEKFTGKMQRGDFSGASRFLGYIRNQELSQAPSGVAQNTLAELRKDQGNRNAEERVRLNQQVSFAKLTQSLYSNSKFKEIVNSIYAEMYGENSDKYKRYRNKTVNQYDLTGEERNAITLAIGLMSQNMFNEDDLSAIDNLQDSVEKRILSNKDLRNYIRRDIQPLINNGLTPNTRSIKEENVLAQQFSFGGTEDILFGAYGTDPSQRAETQSLNHYRKALGTKATRSPFYSPIGEANGVDYQDYSQGVYTGAMVSDNDIYNSLNTVLDRMVKAEEITQKEMDEILSQISVAEGGIIMPKEMATELETYSDFIKEISNKDYVVSKISKLTGRTEDEIRNAPVGTQFVGDHSIQINRKINLGGIGLKADDVIDSIEKTEKGFKVVGGFLTQATEGTKLLGGNAGRYTFKGLNDNIFSELVKQMGLNQNTSFLAESEGISQRKLPTNFRGRIGYIVTEAQRLGKTTDEITQALKSMPVIGKAINEKDGQYYLDMTYDTLSHDFKYHDASGIQRSLFNTDDNGNLLRLSPQELDARIAQVFVEQTQDSSISTLGKQLLGEDEYAKSLNQIATTLNTARITPYYTPTGGMSVKNAERKGGVKVTRKERDALQSGFGVYSFGLTDKAKEGYDAYAKLQTSRFNDFGPKALEAQKNIQKINDAIENKNRINTRQDRIELTWDSSGSWVTDGNKINLAQIVTDYDYDSKNGVNLTDWSGTIGAKIQELRAQMPNAQLILNAQKIASETGMDLSGSKLLRLTDIDDAKFGDGMMPSVANSAYTSLVNSIKDAITTGVKIDISEEVDRVYDKLKIAANDKDSSMFKDAQSVYLSHATHAKAVGLNQAAIDKKYQDTGDISVYNTAYANKNYISSMLRSGKGASAKDMAKNIQEISYMLRASGGLDKLNNLGIIDDNDIERIQNFSNFDRLKNSTKDDLRQLETSIINYVIKYMENGGLLLAQSHRYPSTSGLDIHSSYIGLNNQITDGAIAIGRGQSAEFNADYDGDTVQHWLAMAGFRNTDLSGEEGFKNYEKAYKAAEALSQKESEIAKHMAEWEAQGNTSLSAEELQQDIENKTRELSVAMGSQSKVTDISAFMSKWNKQYVGRFSNPYTNLRRNKTKIGFGELTADSTQQEKQLAANSLLINAFFESLEQDAISAKKVQARLLKAAIKNQNDPNIVDKEGEAIINELTELVDLFNSGNFEDAFNLATEKGIIKVNEDGVIDGRQFEFARAVIQQLDPDIAKQMFGNINGNFGVNSKDLIESFKKLEAYAGQRGFGLKDLTLRNGVTNEDLGRSNADFLNTRRQAQFDSKNIKSTAIPGAEKNNSEPIVVDNNTKVEYQAFLTQNDDDFETSHARTGYELDKTEIGKVDNSVTNLVKVKPNTDNLSNVQKAAMKVAGDRSSTQGTYMHKIMELAAKYNVETGWELFNELVKPENFMDAKELNDAYDAVATMEMSTQGVISADFRDKLNSRAVAMFDMAKKQGLFDKNTYSEVGMGMRIQGIGTVGGSADLMQFKTDENGNYTGVTIGDWKFSKHGGADDPNTVAERILQASEYVHMARQYYSDIISYMNKNGDTSYTDLEGSTISLEEAQKRLDAFKNTDIKILRNYYDKQGNLKQEILESAVVEQDVVEGIMRQINSTQIADYTAVNSYIKNANFKKFDAAGNAIGGKSSGNSGGSGSSGSSGYSSKFQQEEEYRKLIDAARKPGATKFLSNAYEDVDLTQEGLQKLSGIDSILGDFDTSSMTMAKRFNEYSKALTDSKKAITDIIKANTNITDLEQKKNDLLEDSSTDHTETIALLDKEIEKQQTLLKIAQDKELAADKRREATKIDEEVENGTASAKTVVKRHELLTQAKSALNEDVQGMAYDREGKPTIVDNVLKGDKDITQYLNNLKQRQNIEAQIYEMQQKMKGESGEVYKNSQKYVQSLQSTLKTLEQTAPKIDEEKLTEEQRAKLIIQQNLLYQQQEDRIAKINTKQQYSQSFLSKFVTGLKQSFGQFSAANIAFTMTNEVRRGISEIIQYTEQMDSVLVDLQIASGYTRESVHGLMLEYNELGKQLGKSTIDVANAANDWLRAGYEGKEATELTKASTQLATLGMINTSDATSYLISVLKGWKLEASEVSEVVDKLTVTICGVCQVIGIGHKSKSR